MSDALTKLGEAARRAREYISPWAYLSPSDVASNLPGGGIPAAVEPYKQGLQKTAEATQAFREGRWGDAARWYGSGMLDTGTAAVSALPEGGALMKLAAILAPAVKYGDAIWTGASHGRARNHMMRDLPDAEIDKAMTEAASGFIDSKRGFVDRNKAFDIARREDQLLPSIMDKRGELDSEMLIGNGRTTLPPVPAELADEYARLQAGARIDAQPEGSLQKLAGIRPQVTMDMVRAAEKVGDWDPRDFYHGSTQAFDAFDFSKAQPGNYGKGLYVTRIPDKASGYAMGDGGSVYPVQIRRQNALDVTTPEGRSIFEEALAVGGRDAVHEELLRRGFDSIKAPGETVILRPENIRMKFTGE